MGLLSCIEDAGSKPYGGGAQAVTPDAPQKTVENHGLKASKLNVDVQGDKVTLCGQVMKGDTPSTRTERSYGKGKGSKRTEIVTAKRLPVEDPEMIRPAGVLRSTSARLELCTEATGVARCANASS